MIANDLRLAGSYGCLAELSSQSVATSGLVFISTSIITPPFMDQQYLSSKREAEEVLQALPDLRAVVLRPGRPSAPLPARLDAGCWL